MMKLTQNSEASIEKPSQVLTQRRAPQGLEVSGLARLQEGRLSPARMAKNPWGTDGKTPPVVTVIELLNITRLFMGKVMKTHYMTNIYTNIANWKDPAF